MDAGLRRSSRIIQVGMKCHHKYPYKRKAEREGSRQTHREQQEKMKPWQQRSEWCSQQANECRQPQPARDKDESGGNMVLSTLWFQPSKSNVAILAFRTMTEYISSVLSYQFCGNLLHQPQATNTQVHICLSSKFMFQTTNVYITPLTKNNTIILKLFYTYRKQM